MNQQTNTKCGYENKREGKNNGSSAWYGRPSAEIKGWKTPPLPMLSQGPNDEAYCHDDVENVDNEDEEEAPSEDVLNHILQEGNTTQDAEEVAYGIYKQGKVGVMKKTLLTTLNEINHQLSDS